jgi:hypothetical protein
VHLIGFTIEIYYEALSYKRQIKLLFCVSLLHKVLVCFVADCSVNKTLTLVSYPEQYNASHSTTQLLFIILFNVILSFTRKNLMISLSLVFSN